MQTNTHWLPYGFKCWIWLLIVFENVLSPVHIVKVQNAKNDTYSTSLHKYNQTQYLK